MSKGARTRCPRRSASQFRRGLYGAVITGNAAQAGPGLITRTLDRLQAFDGAFLRHREAQLSPFPESALYAARRQVGRHHHQHRLPWPSPPQTSASEKEPAL
jgi:hypothetical protein